MFNTRRLSILSALLILFTPAFSNPARSEVVHPRSWDAAAASGTETVPLCLGGPCVPAASISLFGDFETMFNDRREALIEDWEEGRIPAPAKIKGPYENGRDLRLALWSSGEVEFKLEGRRVSGRLSFAAVPNPHRSTFDLDGVVRVSAPKDTFFGQVGPVLRVDGRWYLLKFGGDGHLVDLPFETDPSEPGLAGMGAARFGTQMDSNGGLRVNAIFLNRSDDGGAEVVLNSFFRERKGVGDASETRAFRLVGQNVVALKWKEARRPTLVIETELGKEITLEIESGTASIFLVTDHRNELRERRHQERQILREAENVRAVSSDTRTPTTAPATSGWLGIGKVVEPEPMAPPAPEAPFEVAFLGLSSHANRANRASPTRNAGQTSKSGSATTKPAAQPRARPLKENCERVLVSSGAGI